MYKKNAKTKRKARARGFSKKFVLSKKGSYSVVTLEIIIIRAIKVASASKDTKGNVIIAKELGIRGYKAYFL